MGGAAVLFPKKTTLTVGAGLAAGPVMPIRKVHRPATGMVMATKYLGREVYNNYVSYNTTNETLYLVEQFAAGRFDYYDDGTARLHNNNGQHIHYVDLDWVRAATIINVISDNAANGGGGFWQNLNFDFSGSAKMTSGVQAGSTVGDIRGKIWTPC